MQHQQFTFEAPPNPFGQAQEIPNPTVVPPPLPPQRASDRPVERKKQTSGLLNAILGTATQVDVDHLQQELSSVLVPGQHIGRAFKTVRDMFIFTNCRLILIDKQGLTGNKVNYHSILYKSITQFSVETAGTFDLDAELKIWVSGALAAHKEFRKGTDVIGLQQYLAWCVFGSSK